MEKRIYVNFIQNHLPLLKSGEYNVQLKYEQVLVDGADRTGEARFTEVLDQKLYVAGKRYVLPTSDIQSVYPPNGSKADYSTKVPHIILKRSTFAWERSIDGTAAADALPWLALLVFDQEEAPMAKTISLESFNTSRNSMHVPSLEEITDAADLLEVGESNEDQVTIIDVPKATLEKLMPMREDLAYLAHCRRDLEGKEVTIDELREVIPQNVGIDGDALWTKLVELRILRTVEDITNPLLFRPADRIDDKVWAGTAFAGKEAAVRDILEDLILEKFGDADGELPPEEGEWAVVVGNRLPKVEGMSTVHLVSLENCFLNGGEFNYGGTANDEPIRLVSFHSWAFESDPENRDFTTILSKVNEATSSSFMLRLPSNGNTLAKPYLDAGYVPLPHHLRIGDNTVSWYRGPLIPGEASDSSAIDILPVETADRLLIYDSKSKLFNTSYAAAWTLGRQMALRDRKFSLQLYHWKNAVSRKAKQRNQQSETGHLPTGQQQEENRLRLFQANGHHDEILAVAISPNGQLLATASKDTTVRLWNANTYAWLHTFIAHTDAVNALAFSPDGRELLTGSDDKTAILWDANTFDLKRRMEHPRAVEAVAFTADGTQLLIGASTSASEGQLAIWNAGDTPTIVDAHTAPITALAVSADGRWIATGAADKKVMLWAVSDFSKTEEDADLGSPVNSLAFAPDSLSLLAGLDNNSSQILGLGLASTGTVAGRFAAYSPDGQKIAAALNDNTATIYDAVTQSAIWQLSGHAGAINSLSFSPDSQKVATGSADNTVRVYKAGKGKLDKIIEGYHTDPAKDAALSKDGSFLVTASADNSLKVWDRATRKLLATLTDNALNAAVNVVAISPDGRWIVAGYENKAVAVWDTEDYTLNKRDTSHPDSITAIAFSPDDTHFATADEKGNVKVWEKVIISNEPTFDVARSLTGLTQAVGALAFSADGQWLAGGGGSGVKLWKVSDGSDGPERSGLSGAILSISFSPDGKKLAMGLDAPDHTAAIWHK
ncbi:MAG TPA: WD40 repeat domain-containing protein, partial [Saprospiraceae bacterium]|nr:WD40 repeat domain-containing protein [Saprospiraceae bacterium]